jgi:putative PEP-CTERM system histidine kinase
MVVGDRVVGVPFTVEELELLKAIGEQMGAGLYSIDLSERLFESREMEAFQTMSAFFVHDLKNTASTLSLTLENLPKYFADPAFREDALKDIGRSANRIENVIQRLTSLRHKLDIRPVATNIGSLVENTMDMLGDAVSSRVVRKLDDVPDVPLDPEQVGKVITNLVLNACDATPSGGEIRLDARMDGDAVVLSVRDSGCGMSHAFIEHSLFRPFRSTKKDGMGIGLFQSRMIVEAHGGTMEVESEEGHGTTFRVRLPVTHRG